MSEEKINLPGVSNLYKITPGLYRSAQPSKKGFHSLEKAGLKSVLNLREYHDDNDEARDTDLVLYHHPLAAGKVTYSDLIQCVSLMAQAPKPILIHCWHGSDRTGIVTAAYLIAVEERPVNQTVHEFIQGPYGHHSRIYGNLGRLLYSIDWNLFREDLKTVSLESKTVRP